jgi:hypothetical protein
VKFENHRENKTDLSKHKCMNLEIMQNSVFPRKGRRENILSKLEFVVTQPKMGKHSTNLAMPL